MKVPAPYSDTTILSTSKEDLELLKDLKKFVKEAKLHRHIVNKGERALQDKYVEAQVSKEFKPYLANRLVDHLVIDTATIGKKMVKLVYLTDRNHTDQYGRKNIAGAGKLEIEILGEKLKHGDLTIDIYNTIKPLFDKFEQANTKKPVSKTKALSTALRSVASRAAQSPVRRLANSR